MFSSVPFSGDISLKLPSKAENASFSVKFNVTAGTDTTLNPFQMVYSMSLQLWCTVHKESATRIIESTGRLQTNSKAIVSQWRALPD